MDDECREVIEAISTLSSGESSGNEKDICSTISNVEEYLNRLLLNDRRKFNMAYVAICTKIFELTCDIPYQRLSWLVHVGVSTEVFNALCTCLATSSLQGSHVIQQLAKDYCSSRLKEMLWSEQPDEQTLTNLINMPQLLGNRLQLDLDEYFIPKTFYTTLISVVCDVLMKCYTATSTASHDYTLSHISYLVSKIITSGYHGNSKLTLLGDVIICNHRCSEQHDKLFRHCYIKRYDMAKNILCSDQSSFSTCGGYICRVHSTEH